MWILAAGITHNQQAGILRGLLNGLSDTLAALYIDMGTRMECITLITQSEFGRRAFDNASLGTDHGHGNCMLAMGGDENGGRCLPTGRDLATASSTDREISM